MIVSMGPNGNENFKTRLCKPLFLRSLKLLHRAQEKNKSVNVRIQFGYRSITDTTAVHPPPPTAAAARSDSQPRDRGLEPSVS